MHLLNIKPVLKENSTHFVESYIYDNKRGALKTKKSILAKGLGTNEISEVKPTAISKPMSAYIATQFQADFQKKHPKLTIKVLSDDKIKPKTVRVNVQGSMNDLKAIKKYGHFPKTNLSRTESVKEQVNFPFPRLKKVNNGFLIDGQLSLEEVLRLPTISFDDEFRFWQEKILLEDLRVPDTEIKRFLKSKNQSFKKDASHKDLVHIIQNYFNTEMQDKTSIFFKQPATLQVGFINEKNQYEVYFFEHAFGETKKEHIDTAFGQIFTHTYKTADALSMLAKRNEILKKLKPAIMISHNGMTYDLTQENLFVQESKKRGFSKEKKLEFLGATPISRQTGFMKKVTLGSITHIDMYPFAQHYLPFTKDNKLITIASLLLNEEITKRISYDKQTQIDIEVMMNVDDIQAKQYAIEDILYYMKAKDWIVKTHYFLGKLFGRNFEDVDNTAKKNIALKRYIADKLKTDPRFSSPGIYEENNYKKFDAQKLFYKKINSSFKVKPKIEKGTLCYLTPWSKLLVNRLKQRPAVVETFSEIKKLEIKKNETSTQNSLFRFVMMYAIEEGLLYPEIYYLYKKDFPNFKYQLEVAQEKYLELVKKYSAINKKGNFIIFPQQNAETDEFNNDLQGLGFKVASGKVFNTARGRFALYDGVNILKMGMDVSGRRGFKNLYHEKLISSAINLALKEEDILKARNFITSFYEKMRHQEIPIEQLVYYKEKVARDYYMYSSAAQRTNFVQACIDKRLCKGDEFAYIDTPNGLVSIDDEIIKQAPQEIYEHNINIDLGKINSSGKRRLGEGKISKLLRPLF